VAAQTPYASNASNPLVAANDYFHERYAAVGHTMVPADIVVLEEDYLVRLVRGQPQAPFVRADMAVISPPVGCSDLHRGLLCPFLAQTCMYFLPAPIS